jgi:hypothetical protein
MSTLTVNVTQEDIDHGISGNCRNCPIALAVIRALDLSPRDYVSVCINDVLVQENGGLEGEGPEPMRCYWLGDDAKRFIYQFDRLDFPDPSPVTLELTEATRL